MTKRAATTERAQHAARTMPEWIVFGASALILGAVVIVLLVLAFQSAAPAEPVADPPGAVRQLGDQFFVPVDVVNRGDEGAAQVQVLAELTIDGEMVTADQVIDFLGRGETQALTFVFHDDPANGELVIDVVGFAEP